MSALLDRLYPPAARQRLRPGGEIERLLDQADHVGARRRAKVEAILAHAEQQGWLDYPTQQRLASGDDIVMLSALYELAVARFLHLRGAGLEPNPPGRGRHIGEFMVWLGETSFFLEVKTLVSPLQESYRSQARWAIVEAAGGISIPAVIEVELQAAPGSGVSIRDLRYYLEQSAQQLLAGAHEPPAYIHRSGLAFRVLRAAPADDEAADGVLQVRFVDWQTPEQLEPPAESRWRERLLRALRGAYEQLPLPAVPSLVVVVDDRDVDHANLPQLLAALGSGFLRPTQHRRLSAVAYYSPLPQLESGDDQMMVIHNPWATSPIACESLVLPDLLQLCLLAP